MSHRISIQCLRTAQCSASSRHVPILSSVIQRNASTAAQKRRRHDPYALAQAQAKKAANKSRQEVLSKERAEILGDPVRGITTPFVRSFDTGTAPEKDVAIPLETSDEETERVNFLLSKTDLENALGRANWLHSPAVTNTTESAESGTEGSERLGLDTPTTALGAALGQSSTSPALEKHAAQMQNADEAVRRIAELSLGSGKDRQRANNLRAIEVFGRHNTDATLRPSDIETNADAVAQMPRAGPDTGSSEVQIAILTAKIRSLADFLEGRGKKDKANKRNLRLLVHRRQKLLQYLRRKDRGGPRWQHVVDTLGLTEGTWKGEISL